MSLQSSEGRASDRSGLVSIGIACLVLTGRFDLKHVSAGGNNFPDNEKTSDVASLDPSEPFDPYNPFPEPVAIPITDVFDLHTIQPRDVKRVVEEYLKEARRLGFRSVRIIHGKGVGVQREMVRAILGRTPFVIDWTDAPPEAGGLGATIVRLKLK